MHTLMKHQRQALQFLRRRENNGLLWMAPGTGKTLVAIRVAKPGDCNLVICRRDDFLTWQTQLLEDGVQKEDIHVIDTGTVEHMPRHPVPGKFLGPIWVLVTYDLTRNPTVYYWLRQTEFDNVFADEVDYLRGWTTQRTQHCVKATRHIPNRVGLTGSPFGNDPAMDVFAQAYWADDGETLGDSWYKHRNSYYIKVGPGWYAKKGSKERIAKACEPLAFHVHEDDVLSLPPKRSIVKGVRMTGMQRLHYERILNDWETELQDGRTLEVDHVVVQLSKLQQIASGFVYDAEKVPAHLTQNKTAWLIDALKNGVLADKQKVVVWCAHIPTINRLHQDLYDIDISGLPFHGGLPLKEREAYRKMFQQGHTRVFIAQADMGRGMNELTVADTAVYYSNSLRVTSLDQSMRRIRRHGSDVHKGILYVHLLAEGTVDVKIHASLQRGKNAAQTILTALKQGAGLRRALQVS